jgi:hypothetical protein
MRRLSVQNVLQKDLLQSRTSCGAFDHQRYDHQYDSSLDQDHIHHKKYINNLVYDHL